MPKELGKDTFPELSAVYEKEGREILGYTLWEDDANYGLPRLDVRWGWADDGVEDKNHAE